MRVCAAPDIQGAIARPGNTRSGLASGSRSEPSESQRREYLRSTDAPESARQLSLRGAQLPHLRSHRSRIDNRHRRLITPRASSAVSASTHHECIHHGPPSIERCGIEKPHHRHHRPLRDAASGHAAALPSSVMNARRFTAQYLPCFRTKGIAHLGTAALRDFNLAYDRCGSKSAQSVWSPRRAISAVLQKRTLSNTQLRFGQRCLSTPRPLECQPCQPCKLLFF